MTTTMITTMMTMMMQCIEAAEAICSHNKHPEATKADPNLITALISTSPQTICHSCRTGEATVEVVLTMKVLVVLMGLITAKFLSGKGADREEGRESWDKD